MDARRRCVYTCRVVEIRPTPEHMQDIVMKDLTIVHDETHPDYNPHMASNVTALTISLLQETHLTSPSKMAEGQTTMKGKKRMASRQQTDDSDSDSDMENYGMEMPSLGAELLHALNLDTSVDKLDLSAFDHPELDKMDIDEQAETPSDRVETPCGSVETPSGTDSGVATPVDTTSDTLASPGGGLSKLAPSTLKLLNMAGFSKYSSDQPGEAPSQASEDDLCLNKMADRLNQAAAKNKEQCRHLSREGSVDSSDSRGSRPGSVERSLTPQQELLQRSLRSPVSGVSSPVRGLNSPVNSGFASPVHELTSIPENIPGTVASVVAVDSKHSATLTMDLSEGPDNAASIMVPVYDEQGNMIGHKIDRVAMISPPGTKLKPQVAPSSRQKVKLRRVTSPVMDSSGSSLVVNCISQPEGIKKTDSVSQSADDTQTTAPDCVPQLDGETDSLDGDIDISEEYALPQLDGVDDHTDKGNAKGVGRSSLRGHKGELPLYDKIALKIKAESLARSMASELGPFKCPSCKSLYRTRESCDKHAQMCDFVVSSDDEEDDEEEEDVGRGHEPLKTYPLRSGRNRTPSGEVEDEGQALRSGRHRTTSEEQGEAETRRTTRSHVTTPVANHTLRLRTTKNTPSPVTVKQVTPRTTPVTGRRGRGRPPKRNSNTPSSEQSSPDLEHTESEGIGHKSQGRSLRSCPTTPLSDVSQPANQVFSTEVKRGRGRPPKIQSEDEPVSDVKSRSTEVTGRVNMAEIRSRSPIIVVEKMIMKQDVDIEKSDWMEKSQPSERRSLRSGRLREDEQTTDTAYSNVQSPTNTIDRSLRSGRVRDDEQTNKYVCSQKALVMLGSPKLVLDRVSPTERSSVTRLGRPPKRRSVSHVHDMSAMPIVNGCTDDADIDKHVIQQANKQPEGGSTDTLNKPSQGGSTDTVNNQSQGDSTDIVSKSSKEDSTDTVDQQVQGDSTDIVSKSSQGDSTDIVEKQSQGGSTDIISKASQGDSTDIVSKSSGESTDTVEKQSQGDMIDSVCKSSQDGSTGTVDKQSQDGSTDTIDKQSQDGSTDTIDKQLQQDSTERVSKQLHESNSNTVSQQPEVVRVDIVRKPSQDGSTDTVSKEPEDGSTNTVTEWSQDGSTDIVSQQSQDGSTDIASQQSQDGSTDIVRQQTQEGSTDIVSQKSQDISTDIIRKLLQSDRKQDLPYPDIATDLETSTAMTQSVKSTTMSDSHTAAPSTGVPYSQSVAPPTTITSHSQQVAAPTSMDTDRQQVAAPTVTAVDIQQVTAPGGETTGTKFVSGVVNLIAEEGSAEKPIEIDDASPAKVPQSKTKVVAMSPSKIFEELRRQGIPESMVPQLMTALKDKDARVSVKMSSTGEAAFSVQKMDRIGEQDQRSGEQVQWSGEQSQRSVEQGQQSGEQGQIHSQLFRQSQTLTTQHVQPQFQTAQQPHLQTISQSEERKLTSHPTILPKYRGVGHGQQINLVQAGLVPNPTIPLQHGTITMAAAPHVPIQVAPPMVTQVATMLSSSPSLMQQTLLQQLTAQPPLMQGHAGQQTLIPGQQAFIQGAVGQQTIFPGSAGPPTVIQGCAAHQALLQGMGVQQAVLQGGQVQGLASPPGLVQGLVIPTGRRPLVTSPSYVSIAPAMSQLAPMAIAPPAMSIAATSLAMNTRPVLAPAANIVSSMAPPAGHAVSIRQVAAHTQPIHHQRTAPMSQAPHVATVRKPYQQQMVPVSSQPVATASNMVMCASPVLPSSVTAHTAVTSVLTTVSSPALVSTPVVMATGGASSVSADPAQSPSIMTAAMAASVMPSSSDMLYLVNSVLQDSSGNTVTPGGHRSSHNETRDLLQDLILHKGDIQSQVTTREQHWQPELSRLNIDQLSQKIQPHVTVSNQSEEEMIISSQSQQQAAISGQIIVGQPQPQVRVTSQYTGPPSVTRQVMDIIETGSMNIDPMSPRDRINQARLAASKRSKTIVMNKKLGGNIKRITLRSPTILSKKRKLVVQESPSSVHQEATILPTKRYKLIDKNGVVKGVVTAEELKAIQSKSRAISVKTLGDSLMHHAGVPPSGDGVVSLLKIKKGDLSQLTAKRSKHVTPGHMSKQLNTPGGHAKRMRAPSGGHSKQELKLREKPTVETEFSKVRREHAEYRRRKNQLSDQVRTDEHMRGKCNI